MLPYIDGFEIAERIRSSDPQMPILMLTARAESADRIKGLETGADDYLTKPFHLDELLLRVKGMLKRKSWYKSAAEKQPLYKFGNNEINFENLICLHGNNELRLTPQEAMLLKYLVERKGEIVTRKELLENVWHLNPDIETRTIDIFIARLRKYFETDPTNPVYIKSIRGAGYTFVGE
jgi:two-component system alkaline phosphatase synthesis response regulator PhoP